MSQLCPTRCLPDKHCHLHSGCVLGVRCLPEDAVCMGVGGLGGMALVLKGARSREGPCAWCLSRAISVTGQVSEWQSCSLYFVTCQVKEYCTFLVSPVDSDYIVSTK